MTSRLTHGRSTTQVLSETAATILAFVAASPDGVSYSDATDAFGPTAGKYLDRLRESGHVTRPKRGVYVVATGNHEQSEKRRGVSERTVTTMLIQLSAALDDAV